MGFWLFQPQEVLASKAAVELQYTFSVLPMENSSFVKYEYTDGTYSFISNSCFVCILTLALYFS